MRIVCHKSQPPTEWDNLLNIAQGSAGLCQSSYWARVIAQVDHADPIFVYVQDDNETVVLSLLLFKKSPWDRERQHKNYRAFFSDGWPGWLEWLDGPVIHTNRRADIYLALTALFVWLDEYAKENKLSAIRSHGLPHISNWAGDEGIRALFVEAGYATRCWATYLVNLEMDDETLWKQIDHAARKSVKRARNQNVLIVPMRSVEELENRFYLPYRSIEMALGRKTDPFFVARKMWEEDREGYYRFFVAETSTGETLATLGMYIFNGLATEIISTLSPKAFELKIPAQDLLHWEMLLEAKKAGCHTFDLAGVNPDPSDPKEAGIRRFKEKWGGRYVEYDTFEKRMVSQNLQSTARALIRRIRQTVGK